ncbi:hypothetical protein HPB49_002149 [Dermacentor silvarum]|uniref:Uncharacterized protein n=1 Tax=Dermacentor silvarum TaxID=543639 RepID=A0ACB8CP48_DERSI|nr:hypothetical protein HPB49_002149 [Dermacentor silvarum]
MCRFSLGFSSLRTQQDSPITGRSHSWLGLTTSTPVAGGGGAAKLNMARSASAPLRETMQSIEIDGKDFREDDANNGGWNLVQRKPTGRKKTGAFEFLNRPRIAQDGGRVGAKSGRRIPELRMKVFAASRIPELPEEHQKIIETVQRHYGVSTAIIRAAGISSMEAETVMVCPNIVPNIVVVCTEKESNARKLLRIKSISVNGKEHEVGVYAAARDGFVKGVLRNVEPGISETLYRCYLYKKQIEVCYYCDSVGHRADICPTPTLKQDASSAEKATAPATKHVRCDRKRRSSSDKEEESTPRRTLQVKPHGLLSTHVQRCSDDAARLGSALNDGRWSNPACHGNMGQQTPATRDYESQAATA